MVKIILDAGVHVDVRDAHNTTPLHVALARGSKACVGLLLESGANCNSQDEAKAGSTDVKTIASAFNLERENPFLSKSIHLNSSPSVSLSLFPSLSDPVVSSGSASPASEVIAPRSWLRDATRQKEIINEAVDILKKNVKFESMIEWGMDFNADQERFSVEEVFKKPMIVYNHPKQIKSFSMCLNDDGVTIASMDVLVPKVGVLMSGSQREERYEVLEK
ncbi:hypothetical protein SUGI_0024130 [Cryptomeria japonica]|nr:hypothetical protein SUGI_0024130 [Cryptomeria japonica]